MNEVLFKLIPILVSRRFTCFNKCLCQSFTQANANFLIENHLLDLHNSQTTCRNFIHLAPKVVLCCRSINIITTYSLEVTITQLKKKMRSYLSIL